MTYCRLPTGTRWHILHAGRTLCGVTGEHVETATREGVPDDGVCWNCDQRWREMGRAKKPKRVWKKPDLAAYRPRHKERFE